MSIQSLVTLDCTQRQLYLLKPSDGQKQWNMTMSLQWI